MANFTDIGGNKSALINLNVEVNNGDIGKHLGIGSDKNIVLMPSLGDVIIKRNILIPITGWITANEPWAVGLNLFRYGLTYTALGVPQTKITLDTVGDVNITPEFFFKEEIASANIASFTTTSAGNIYIYAESIPILAFKVDVIIKNSGGV